MSREIRSVFPGFLLVAMLQAQAPPAASAKPDSAAVKKDIEKAKKTAGTEWAAEAHFFATNAWRKRLCSKQLRS